MNIDYKYIQIASLPPKYHLLTLFIYPTAHVEIDLINFILIYYKITCNQLSLKIFFANLISSLMNYKSSEMTLKKIEIKIIILNCQHHNTLKEQSI